MEDCREVNRLKEIPSLLIQLLNEWRSCTFEDLTHQSCLLPDNVRFRSTRIGSHTVLAWLGCLEKSLKMLVARSAAEMISNVDIYI